MISSRSLNQTADGISARTVFFDRDAKGLTLDAGRSIACETRHDRFGTASTECTVRTGLPSWGGRRNRGTARSCFLPLAPQPSSAAHPARVAMNGRKQASNHIIREDVLLPQPGNLPVQRRYARKTASQHDRIGSIRLIIEASPRARRSM